MSGAGLEGGGRQWSWCAEQLSCYIACTGSCHVKGPAAAHVWFFLVVLFMYLFILYLFIMHLFIFRLLAYISSDFQLVQKAGSAAGAQTCMLC